MKNKIKKIFKYYKSGEINKQNIRKMWQIIQNDGLKAAVKKVRNYTGPKFPLSIVDHPDAAHALTKNSHYTEYFDIINKCKSKNINGKAIVFVTPCLSYGGGELYLLSLAQSVYNIDPSFHVYIIVPEFIGECNKEIYTKYSFLTVIPCRDFITKDNIAESYNFLKIFVSLINPQIFHNVNSSIAWQLITKEENFLKKHVNKIYACIFCPQYDKRGNIEGFAKDFLEDGIKVLDLLISDNANFKAFAKENFLISSNDINKITPIYAPCKLSLSESIIKAQNKNYEFRTKSKQNIKLLWIARLDEQKNVSLLFDIAREYPEFQIYVYGTKLVDRDTDFGTAPVNINFMGLELDIAKIMLDNDYTAMIMTSKYEGIPNVIVECGYLNLPIIAPDVGGVSDIVAANTGYLLSSSPLPQDYKKIIDQIIANPDEKKLKTDNMFNLVNQRHTIKAMEESLVQLKYLQINDLQITKLPIVSVIIPCYNQYQFLISCIESVYRAYSGPLDIIVIDDNSTDNKKKLYQTIIMNMFKNVKFINNEKNLGVSATRNIGIDNAIGEYIQFLDADDILLPNKISIQVSFFTDNKQVFICDYFLSDSEMEHLKYESSIKQFELNLENFLLVWERGFCIPIHTPLFPAQIKQVKFNSNLPSREDWYFWINLLQDGYSLHYIDYTGVVYRMNPNSSTHSKFVMSGKAWIDAAYYVLDKIKHEDIELKSKFLLGVSTHYQNHFIPNSIVELADQQNNKNVELALILEQSSGLSMYENEINKFADSFKLPEVISNITIIIPVYNHFDYLWQCIQSAINQSVAAKQIIVLNDNSSDNRVIKLLLLIESKFLDLVKIINFTENIGISNVQNHAISIANSEYIAFLDCDDYLETEALATVYDVLSEKKVDYLFTDNYHIKGQHKQLSRYGGYSNIKYTSDNEIYSDLLNGMVANHLKVIRKEAMLMCGLFDLSVSGVQDWDLALKFCARGFSFKYLPKALYNHRIHAYSVTNSMRTAQFRLTNIVRRKYLELRYPYIMLETDNIEYISSKCELSFIKESLLNSKTIIFIINDSSTLEDYWFVKEFNAYFNHIIISNPRLYAPICGYLWDSRIVEIGSANFLLKV